MPTLPEVLPWIDAKKRQVLAELATAAAAPETVGPNIWGALKDMGRNLGLVQTPEAAQRDEDLKSIMFQRSPQGEAAIKEKIAEAMMGFGEGGLAGIIKGRHALTWNPVTEKAAQILEKTRSPEDVHAATGLWRPHAGPGQIYRGEISDAGSILRPHVRDTAARVARENSAQSMPVADALIHPELYKNYPELANMELSLAPGAGGVAKLSLKDPIAKFMVQVGAESPSIQSSLLHELTHVIQAKEGYNVGGAPTGMLDRAGYAEAEKRARVAIEAMTKRGESPIAIAEWVKWLEGEASRTGDTQLEAYRHIPGEVEARNVQLRRFMAPEELATSYPPSTYDVNPKNILWKYWNDWGKEGRMP